MAESSDLGVRKSELLPNGPRLPQEAALGKLGERAVRALPTLDERLQELDRRIGELKLEVTSLQALQGEIKTCSEAERTKKIEAARALYLFPLNEECPELFQNYIHRQEALLRDVQHYRDYLSASAPRGTLKTYGLEDKDVVDLTLPKTLQEIEVDWTGLRDSIGGLFQRIYFETQGGPTRRKGRRPGDELAAVTDFGGSSSSIMFLNLSKNLKAFYEGLTGEEQKTQEHLFLSLFDTLERAKPLFFMVNLAAVGNFGLREDPRVTFLEVARSANLQVLALEAGDFILLPGISSNHAVLCEIQRQKDGTLTLTLYNSDPHGEKLHRKMGGKYSNIRVRNIDPERLNEPFFLDFFALATKSQGMGLLYRLLQTLGTAEPDTSYHYDQGDVRSCTYQCLLRWLKEHMGQQLYHRVREHTLKALLTDYANHFGGQVREDGTVRVMTSHSAEYEVAGSEMNKLTKYATRALQKIGRGIFIEQAVDHTSSLPGGKIRQAALQQIVESDEVRKTVLNEQDRCLVLMKIGARLSEHRPPYNQEAQLFFDQAVHGAEGIEDPEQQSATFYQIAQTLFLHGQEQAGFSVLDRSGAAAERIEDIGQRADAVFDIAKSLFSQKGHRGEVLKYVDKATEGVVNIDDPTKKVAMVKEIGQELLAWGEVDRACALFSACPGHEMFMFILEDLCKQRILESDFEGGVRILNAMVPLAEKFRAGVEAKGELSLEPALLYGNKLNSNPMIRALRIVEEVLWQGEYQKACAFAERLPVADFRAQALMKTAEELFAKDPDLARSVMERAIEAARSVSPSITSAGWWDQHYPRWELLLNMCETLSFEWKVEGGEKLIDEALEAAEGVHDQQERDEALQWIAETFKELGLLERAKEVERKRITYTQTK